MSGLGIRLAVFPEMAVTGYTCGDLFLGTKLIEDSRRAIDHIAAETATMPIAIVVGTPLPANGQLLNAAAVICRGEVHYVGKTYIPNYSEFYEKRWFGENPDGHLTLFELDGFTFGVEICEDLWAPIPPSSRLALAGAEVILNLSASDSLVGKRRRLRELITSHSAATHSVYVYAGAGYGESTTDLVFDGKVFMAENGRMLTASTPWNTVPVAAVSDVDIDLIRSERRSVSTFADCARRELCGVEIHRVKLNLEPAQPADMLYREVDPMPFVPTDSELLRQNCEEIAQIQSLGLARRLEATHCRNVVVGISGGLDSTLALLVAVKTFDRLGLPRTGIHAVTMPGFGTSQRTRSNADALMEALGVTVRTIPIAAAVEQHFRDIGHDPSLRDITYENAQARMRTLLLMDIANQVGGMVIGTGDLSELALGWATYNGDHMSMYGLNAGVPKTAVREVVRHFASQMPDIAPVLHDIIATPVSPELLPADSEGQIAQITEDNVGPYELHDFFLYHFMRLRRTPAKILTLAVKAFEDKYDVGTIEKWLNTFLRRFFAQQFKRSCLPDGPKVGTVAISPRGDWRMPSDASSQPWLL